MPRTPELDKYSAARLGLLARKSRWRKYTIDNDAPIGEGQSRWVIDAAKAKYPGKPIKQLVLTHHHMDHSSGARTYVAEGAEIVIPGQARGPVTHNGVGPGRRPP